MGLITFLGPIFAIFVIRKMFSEKFIVQTGLCLVQCLKSPARKIFGPSWPGPARSQMAEISNTGLVCLLQSGQKANKNPKKWKKNNSKYRAILLELLYSMDFSFYKKNNHKIYLEKELILLKKNQIV